MKPIGEPQYSHPGQEPGHARRNLMILGVGVGTFLVAVLLSDARDRAAWVFVWGFLVLGPTVLVVIVLSRADAVTSQRGRFQRSSVLGRIMAASGFPLPTGTPVLFTARGDGISVDAGGGRVIHVPIDAVLGLAFGGPGTQITSVSVIGTGFDFGPVGFGSASGSVSTATATFVSVTATSGAFTILTDDADPSVLEGVFAECLLVLRRRHDMAAAVQPQLAAKVPTPVATVDPRIAALEKLAALHAAGVLTNDELIREKTRILGD